MDEDLFNNTTAFYPQLHYARYDYTITELILHRATETLIGLVTIFSAFTNSIAVYVLLNEKFGKRTVIKYLYANISLSDEFLILAGLIEAGIYGQSSCGLECRRFLGLTLKISGCISAYTMALIAFKRYYGIAYPLKEFSQNHKKLPYFVAVIVIWSMSVGLTIQFTNYVPVQERNETLLLQSCTWLSYNVKATNEYPYFHLITVVVVPLMLGLYFSSLTIVILQRQKQIGDHVDIVKLEMDRKRKLRATFMIVVVIVSFLVCWLPITVVAIVYKLNYATMKPCDYNYILYVLATFFVMLSIFINPVIYWYMSPDFRQGVNHIFSRFKLSSRPKQQSSSRSGHSERTNIEDGENILQPSQHRNIE